jgi:hypothetical protein
MCTIRISEIDDLSRLEKARAAVSNLKGVVKSDADQVSQMLTVEYDPDRITRDEIRNAVRRGGVDNDFTRRQGGDNPR